MIGIFEMMIIGGGIFVVLVVVLVIALYRMSFRNKAMIARQTGKDPNDVIWLEDKFRVQNVNGLWIIKFLRLREKTTSVAGSNWSKFLSKKKQNKILKFTSEQWQSKDLGKLIQRGIFFYETTEGEFFPMTVQANKEGNPVMERIDQDNRMFVITETQNANSLTKNHRREYFVLGGLVAGCVLMGLIFIFGIIYMHDTSVKTLSVASGQAARTAQAIINGTDQGQFIGQVTQVVGG